MQEHRESLERALEEAISRALRDNLGPLQRTADDLQQAYADLIAACSSSRPSNSLPAMLRAQTAAAALAAGLSVLSNFVAIALNPRDRNAQGDQVQAEASTVVELDEPVSPPAEAPPEPQSVEEAPRSLVAPDKLVVEPELQSHVEAPGVAAESAPQIETEAPEPEIVVVSEPEISVAAVVPEAIPAEAEASAPAFDVASFPADIQELHRRANRVAKVAMQDIKLLRPKDVELGREHQDICDRLRSDLDKARKEYDRRFRAIQDHPVDYFHRWMVEILADGRIEALGEYPYPSPVLRH